MQLFPAIDLRGGKVVRLTQGDYDRMTVYGEDPCAQAREFLAAGAKNLHVVDLDGAKDGTLSNYDTIAALAKQGRKKALKMGGIMYHLYHREASKTNEQYHVKVLQQVKLHQLNWCQNGIALRVAYC